VKYEKIPVGRFGTLAEIRALADWCEKNRDVKSLLAISSGYHLRRVRMCCRALLPRRVQCAFVAAPQSERTPMVQLAEEMVKFGVYWVMLMARR
jgi:hypothetical protein